MNAEVMKYENIGEYRKHPLNERSKRTKMNDAAHLVGVMMFNNATDEECNRVFEYMDILYDAIKYNLDWKKARKELRIDDLEAIYLA